MLNLAKNNLFYLEIKNSFKKNFENKKKQKQYMKKTLLLIIILIFYKTFFAQNYSNIDSLKKVINTTDIDTVKVLTLCRLSSKYVNYQTDSAKIYLDQALKISKKINYQYGIAMSYINQSDIEIILGNNEKSKQLIYKGMDILEQINRQKRIAGGYNRLAKISYIESDYPKAIKFLNKALNIYKTIKDSSGISQEYSNLAIIYRMLGDYKNALDLNFKSLKIDEKLNNDDGISSSYNNIAIIYNYQEQYTKALNYYFKALKTRKKNNNTNKIASIYNNIGLVYVQKEIYDSALFFIKKSVKLTNKKNKNLISTRYLNLASIYMSLDSLDKAIAYSDSTLKYKKQTKELRSQGKIFGTYSEIYFKKGDIKKSKNYAEKQFSIAKQIGDKELIKEGAYNLAKIYSTLNNAQKTFEFFEIYNKYKDSLRNDELTKKITTIENQYVFEKQMQAEKLKQQKKEELHKAKIKQQNTIKYFLIAIVLVLVVFAIFVFINLRRKIKDNKLLSEKNAVINQQKEEIITQAESLKKANSKISDKNKILSVRNKLITDSINYAKKIQTALLSDKKFLKKNFKNSFIFFKPKDIVSGDFYWFKKIKNTKLIAIADCTGHGVPGAFMSMLGISVLNEITKKEILQPSQILEQLRSNIKYMLKQTGNSDDQKDGMDIALCKINQNNQNLEFAGANNPLFIIRDKKIIKISATPNPIGIYINEKPFKNNKFKLQENDKLYMFSDGYVDQFGGKNNEKFMIKRLKELLLSTNKVDLQEQKNIIIDTFYKWKSNNSQIDDVILIGFEI